MRQQLGAAINAVLDAVTRAYADQKMYYRGAWVPGTSYAVNDVVTYNNGLYICTTAINPSSPASYVGSSKTFSTSAAGANLPLPAGAAVGDLMVLALSSNGGGSTVAVSGFTPTVSASNGNGRYFASVKALTSTDLSNNNIAIPAQTGQTNWAAVSQVFRNVTGLDTTVAQTQSNATPVITPAANSYVVQVCWNLHDTTADGTMTQANVTALVTQGDPSGVVGACVGAGYDLIASGATTARIFGTAGNGGVPCAAAIPVATAGFDTTKWTFIGYANASPIQAGTVFQYVAAAAPAGYLLCDGASYSRATYPTLFGVIGTTYGAADGTHFNVPDLRGRVGIGYGPAFPTLGATGTGGHTHPLSAAGAAEIYQSTAGFTAAARITLPGGVSYTETTRISGTNATPASGATLGAPLTGATDSTVATPPYQVVNHIIKT